MSSPKRLLVDWDYCAPGLWEVLREREQSQEGTWHRLVERGRPSGADSDDLDAVRPYSELLSVELLEDLLQWNMDCEAVYWPLVDSPEYELDPASELLDARALQLAKRVQAELGPGYEVLYAADGAWTWIEQPRNWNLS